MRDNLKEKQIQQLGTSSPLVLDYGTKAVWCHVRKRLSPLGGWIIVPTVTFFFLFFLFFCSYGMLEWEVEGNKVGWWAHVGQFQKVSTVCLTRGYSVYLKRVQTLNSTSVSVSRREQLLLICQVVFFLPHSSAVQCSAKLFAEPQVH